MTVENWTLKNDELIFKNDYGKTNALVNITNPNMHKKEKTKVS